MKILIVNITSITYRFIKFYIIICICRIYYLHYHNNNTPLFTTSTKFIIIILSIRTHIINYYTIYLSIFATAGLHSTNNYVNRAAKAAVDKFTDPRGFKYPASECLLAECLKSNIIRGLNEVWIQLSYGKCFTNKPHNELNT